MRSNLELVAATTRKTSDERTQDHAEKVVQGPFPDGQAESSVEPAAENKEEPGRRIERRYKDSARKTFNFSPRTRDLWRAIVEDMLAEGAIDVGDMPADTWIFERILQTMATKDGDRIRPVSWSRVCKEAESFQRKPEKG